MHHTATWGRGWEGKVSRTCALFVCILKSVIFVFRHWERDPVLPLSKTSEFERRHRRHVGGAGQRHAAAGAHGAFNRGLSDLSPADDRIPKQERLGETVRCPLPLRVHPIVATASAGEALCSYLVREQAF